MIEKLKRREYIGYGAGDVGINLLTLTMSLFVTIYYTDSVGISAATVGTMMFITRLFDGVSDLGMGFVVDRTHSKLGKARPWILWMALPLFILFVLMFNVPMSMGQNGKVVFMYITYFLFTVVFFTAFFVPYNSLIPLMAASQDTRNKLATARFFMVMIAALIIVGVTIPLQQAIGWTALSFLYGSLAVGFFLWTFFMAKERHGAKEVKYEKSNVLEEVKSLFKNKFFLPLVILFVLNYVIMGLAGIGVYYAKDVVGNINIMGLFAIASIVPQLIGLPLFPGMARKHGKYRLFIIGSIIRVLGKVILLIAPTDINLLVASSVIVGIGGIPFSAGMYALISDVIDFGEWKTHRRTEGLINSVSSFGNKVGMGLGTAMVGWIIAFGGYDGGAAVQSAKAVASMKFVNIHLHIILFVLILIVSLFCNIDKIYPTVETELKKRRVPNLNKLATE